MCLTTSDFNSNTPVDATRMLNGNKPLHNIVALIPLCNETICGGCTSILSVMFSLPSLHSVPSQRSTVVSPLYEYGPAQGFFLLKWTFSLSLLLVRGSGPGLILTDAE